MGKITRLLLVHSSHYDDQGKVVRADRLIDKLSVANVVHSALPYLAAYVSPEIEMELVEDCFEDVNYDDPAEVVAISAQVMQIRRALDLAAEFRKRGKIVLMGGYLASMHPDLVAPHVDALCIGDGDQVFPQMLKDIENGSLKKIYQGTSEVPLDNIPTPRYDLIKKDRTVLYPIHATRGCPFKCDYCSIIQFHGHTYRHRPVAHVIRDIKAAKKHSLLNLIFFSDDNLMEDFEYAKELFRQMIPLKVVWGTQTTINIHKDRELLELAYKAGCRWVALGMESLSQANLNQVNKGFNRADKFAEQIAQIQDVGIAVHALIMFGLEQDTPAVFDDTLRYLEELNITIAEFFINTPYPATPAGRQALQSGVIIDGDLSHYREGYVVFKHPHMDAETIMKNFWRVLREFYSIKNILRRWLKSTYKNKIYHLTNSFYYWLKIKRNIVPVYFGAGNQKID
ncbi:MAG: hypothetical protein A2X86_11780 [Bdellovibrionales bacterium GWA2_49_15]|nr:MAG: hypothetical protein A2X86_11780 [Bdellovibrionales bacterium GWA2_49_15]HAZ12569.1 hypothetical protein [Bdellovibrionales bacterium]